MARPTIYKKAILKKAKQYLEDPLPKDEVVHSIEGLAEAMDITRTTIYDWESQDDKKEFSYIVGQVRQRQAKTLINKGLDGTFVSPVVKVMLSKHNYSEKIQQEVTGDGLKTIIINKNGGDDQPSS